MASLIKVTLKRSLSKCSARQKGTVQGLGLRTIRRSRYLMDTPEIRGMVLSVQHLLEVQRLDGDPSLRVSKRLQARRSEGALT